jgi:hypothetical protein
VDCFVSDVSNKSARSRSGAFLSTALEYKCDEVMDILLIELKGDESLEENNETPKVLEEISNKIRHFEFTEVLTITATGVSTVPCDGSNAVKKPENVVGDQCH